MPVTSFARSRQVREITYQNFLYTDTTAIPILEVPAGARCIAWIINVTTAFLGVTTLSITDQAGTAIVTSANVAALGMIAAGTTLVNQLFQPTVMTTFYAVMDAGTPTAGQCDITLTFSYDRDSLV